MQRTRKISLVLSIIFATVFTVAFFLLCSSGIHENIVKKEDIFLVNSEVFETIISLPKVSDYLLQLKFDAKNTDAELAKLNNNKLELRISNSSENCILSRYYYVPKEIMVEGNNKLQVHFYPNNPKNLMVRTKNFLGQVHNENIILTLRDSVLRNNDLKKVLLPGIIFFFFIVILWWIMLLFELIVLNLSIKQSILNNIFSFIFCAFFCLVLGYISLKGPYSLVVQIKYAFLFVCINVAFANMIVNLLTWVLLNKLKDDIGRRNIGDNSLIFNKIFYIINKVFLWIKEQIIWVLDCKFSDKCLVAFMSGLILCAILRSIGLKKWLDTAGTVAYFFLVSGISIKFFQSIFKKE
ncbi:MAG: hypothetical protein ABIG64_05730 [Candidatus Omnitrophota bacterium]